VLRTREEADVTVINEGRAFRKGILGNGPVSKATGAITGNPTTALFTVAGGEVLITGIWGKVTTALSTDSGTYSLVANPTTGDTQTIVTATDLGTTDTAVGSLVGLTNGTTAAPAFLRGGTAQCSIPVTTGQIEFVGAASANGALTFYVTWIPLTDGATLVAA
jgi:hypothetical protein